MPFYRITDFYLAHWCYQAVKLVIGLPTTATACLSTTIKTTLGKGLTRRMEGGRATFMSYPLLLLSLPHLWNRVRYRGWALLQVGEFTEGVTYPWPPPLLWVLPLLLWTLLSSLSPLLPLLGNPLSLLMWNPFPAALIRISALVVLITCATEHLVVLIRLGIKLCGSPGGTLINKVMGTLLANYLSSGCMRRFMEYPGMGPWLLSLTPYLVCLISSGLQGPGMPMLLLQPCCDLAGLSLLSYQLRWPKHKLN